MEKSVPAGRLAIRIENDIVVGYYAQIDDDDMKNAITLFTVDEYIANLPGTKEIIVQLGKHVINELLSVVIKESDLPPISGIEWSAELTDEKKAN